MKTINKSWKSFNLFFNAKKMYNLNVQIVKQNISLETVMKIIKINLNAFTYN